MSCSGPSAARSTRCVRARIRGPLAARSLASTARSAAELNRRGAPRARYYAAWLGRWTAADPLGLEEPGRPDLNLYAYVRNKPAIAIDPNGLESSDDTSKQTPRLQEKPSQDNKLTGNPNERSYFRNFPDHQKPGGLGPKKFKELLQDDVRQVLGEELGIKPEEVDERVVEVVLAQAALETDYGRALFNSNIGNERSIVNRPHVYVEGAYEGYKTKEAALRALSDVGEGFGRIVERKVSEKPYRTYFDRQPTAGARFAAFDNFKDGVRHYLQRTLVLKGAEALQDSLSQAKASGKELTLSEYVEIYYESLRNDKGQHYATASKSSYVFAIKLRVASFTPSRDPVFYEAQKKKGRVF